MRTILGLDPGLARVGYGLIAQQGSGYRHVAHGAIRTRTGRTVGQRLGQIYDEMDRLIRRYRPATAAVETLFFDRATPSALLVAQARGALLLCLEHHDVPVTEYAPGQVKLAVLGRGAGRAEKRQVQEMVRMLLGLRSVPKPYDAADGLAIAICHGNATWVTLGGRKSTRSNAE